MTTELYEKIRNPRYCIFYKGKEVRRYAFYRQAVAYCIKHNRLLTEEKVTIVDLETGEEREPQSQQLSLF